MSAAPVKVWTGHDGRLLRLRLVQPKANIVDAAMIDALTQAFRAHADEPELQAVVLDAEGPNFSFGASIEEHLPGRCADMLQALHGLILEMLGFPVPILVAVRGQCLGGGLELACAGTVLFAAPDARLGQPEIRLAVFAPAASCLLPERVGAARAEELLLSGRSIDAAEALRIGLVHEVADDPEAAALDWFDRHLAGGSASSLRLALEAVRLDTVARIESKLAKVERLYLERLMRTADAVEGLDAFLAKRAPEWRHA